MRRYESVVILDPDLADDDIRSFTDRYTQTIKSGGGEIIKIEDWGVKKLAYLVRKKERGRYLLFDYVGMPALIAEIERQFKIAEEVMKYQSVKLDPEVDLEAFKSAPKPVEDEAPTGEPEVQAPAEAEAEAASIVTTPVEPDQPIEPTAVSTTSLASEPVAENLQPVSSEPAAPEEAPADQPVQTQQGEQS